MRQKLQNRKGYTESLEFPPAKADGTRDLVKVGNSQRQNLFDVVRKKQQSQMCFDLKTTPPPPPLFFFLARRRSLSLQFKFKVS